MKTKIFLSIITERDDEDDDEKIILFLSPL